METKYPNIQVQLTGTDGNAFAIIGAVSKALKKAGVPQDQIWEFHEECMSGDYNNLIQIAMKWVEVS